MQFFVKFVAAVTIVMQMAYALPQAGDNSTDSVAASCTRNTGLHCQKSSAYDKGLANAALTDLMSLCSNGNFPQGAKRVASGLYGDYVAYACNSFCKGGNIPCQDAAWSINRVIQYCNYFGYDSQESRGTWFGIARNYEAPCGYQYTGKGTI